MKLYQISTPRSAFAFAAVAMTAITIGIAVVVPAQMQSGIHGAPTLAAAAAPSRTTDVAVRPLRIEVFGAREAEFVSVKANKLPAKRKQES